MKVQRLGLIISDKLQANAGQNINGATCVEMPEWYKPRLGNFHLYFADHSGQFIKVAYTDNIESKWSVSPSRTINLSRFRDAYDHIASPEVFIDHSTKTLRLYFHARARSKGREQWTFMICYDQFGGVTRVVDEPLAAFYLRVFKYGDFFYGVSKGGLLWRSTDGLSPFELGPNLINPCRIDDLWQNEPGDVRHSAVDLDSELLEVFFTRIGDKPERIYAGFVNLSKASWLEWVVKDVSEVLRPERVYEGGALPLSLSKSGPSLEMENSLRDPYVLRYKNERYLFYSVAGERGIALAKIS